MASTSSSQSVIENDTIALDCKVSSNPQPTFTWYKNGVEINDLLYISTSTHSSRIMLHNISTADAGNYSCFTQNIVGNTTSNPIAITVYGKAVRDHVSTTYQCIFCISFLNDN